MVLIAIAIAIAACVDPPSPPSSPVDPSSTTDQPIIGGSAFTGPTRVVMINIPPKGLCTGILLNEDTVLTAFHCVEKGVPAGTTVSHPLGAAT
ncbi:MAG TPA: trypsin-like serine protease, partial [Kofleriaceae bacterium]|nr:trypsin-like serine protease [Kofleriaceae bacterium]